MRIGAPKNIDSSSAATTLMSGSSLPAAGPAGQSRNQNQGQPKSHARRPARTQSAWYGRRVHHSPPRVRRVKRPALKRYKSAPALSEVSSWKSEEEEEEGEEEVFDLSTETSDFQFTLDPATPGTETETTQQHQVHPQPNTLALPQNTATQGPRPERTHTRQTGVPPPPLIPYYTAFPRPPCVHRTSPSDIFDARTAWACPEVLLTQHAARLHPQSHIPALPLHRNSPSQTPTAFSAQPPHDVRCAGFWTVDERTPLLRDSDSQAETVSPSPSLPPTSSSFSLTPTQALDHLLTTSASQPWNSTPACSSPSRSCLSLLRAPFRLLFYCCVRGPGSELDRYDSSTGRWLRGGDGEDEGGYEGWRYPGPRMWTAFPSRVGRGRDEEAGVGV